MVVPIGQESPVGVEAAPPPAPRRSALLKHIPVAGALLAAVIALIALIRLRMSSPAANPAAVSQAIMVPATSTGVLLAAGSLLLLYSSRRRATWLGSLLASLVVALGAGAIGCYAAEWLGIAERATSIMPDAWWAQLPAPGTALALLLLGTSLLTFRASDSRLRRWSIAGIAATLIIAVAGLVGHAYGASILYGLNRSGGTALSTATALSALALGLLLSDPSRGFAALAAGDSAGSQLLRRLTPAAILAPLLLGWVALSAYQRGFTNSAFAAALLVVILIVFLVGLIIRLAMSLHEIDAEREHLRATEREASAHVNSILESITDAFFAVDREWRFTYVNREAERLLARPREELLGRIVWDQFSGAIGTAFQHHYELARTTRTTVSFEEYYAPLDRWFDVRAFPTPDGLSVYFSDITARKQVEEKLRESEERYRLLADMIPQHIWTTDAHGYHNYFSRRWYEFTGVAQGESLGEAWMERLHPDDRDRTAAAWQHSLRTGERYSIEYRFRNAAGEYCWFWGQAVPQRDESGEIIRWFGTLTDISERKRLEEEREELLLRERTARGESESRREELERVSESRTRLMRGFSHDVKNPLGAADGHAQLLEDGILGELNERQVDSIRRIRRSISTSLRLIGDLLELARAESGQIDIECVATDVTAAAREVVDDFRAQADAVGLVLTVSGPDRLQAETDPTRLRQILANLLSNAVKYAPQGQATISTRILEDRSGRLDRQWVAVSVTDSGAGIPQSKREAIFQEFTRLDPQAQSGAGVGLAISRRIARLMGGDLTVESEIGHGSTFTLWLPPASSNGGSAADHA